MSQYYEYELGKAAKILCEELFKLKPGETFVITADTESDERVVEATASAAFACGAKPMVITVASPLGVGKAADPMLPLEALTLSLIHISEPTRLGMISYAVFCLKKKKQ